MKHSMLDKTRYPLSQGAAQGLHDIKTAQFLSIPYDNKTLTHLCIRGHDLARATTHVACWSQLCKKLN